MNETSSTDCEQDRADKLRTLAEGLAGTVRLLRVMAEARRTVDLDGLESRVGLLCAQAFDLSPVQGTGMVPSLAAVLAEIDELAKTLACDQEPRPASLV